MDKLILWGPLSLLAVWGFLLYRAVRSWKRFAGKVGVRWTSLFFSFPFRTRSPEQEEAWRQLRKEAIVSMIIWITALIIFVVVLLAAGILTGEKK